MNYLTFDIGGTYVRFALFRYDKLISEGKYNTIKDNSLLEFLEEKIEGLMKMYKIKKFKGIGISAPGVLNCDKLELTAPVNIPKIKNLKFDGFKKYSKKVILENDANCAAVGANTLENVNNLVGLTLGTGLGTGLIINGKLYKGKGNASEFGHTTIDVNSGKCCCGNIGCLEGFASEKGLLKLAKKNGLDQNAFELRELGKKGDKKALKIFNEFGKNLSFGLVNIANILDPDVIVLSGGLVNSSKFFIDTAKKEAKKRYFPGINPRIKIYEQNLSLLGALELVK
jgi:glucokinase